MILKSQLMFCYHIHAGVSCNCGLLSPPNGLDHLVFENFSSTSMKCAIDPNGEIVFGFHIFIPILNRYRKLKGKQIYQRKLELTSASFKPPNLKRAGFPFSTLYSLVTLPLLLQLRDLKVFSFIFVISVTMFICSGFLQKRSANSRMSQLQPIALKSGSTFSLKKIN